MSNRPKGAHVRRTYRTAVSNALSLAATVVGNAKKKRHLILKPREIIEGSPAIKSSTIAYSDRFIMTVGGVVNIYDNLVDSDCRLILESQKIKQIQFADKFKVSSETFDLMNSQLLTDKSNPTLRLVLNGYGLIDNLDCLELLSNTKSLAVDMFKNKQIENINKYLNLQHLTIGGQGLSIKPISEQKDLLSLFVFEKLKDIEIIGELSKLQKLTFSKLTPKNLTFLLPLKTLEELNFILGSSTDYGELPQIDGIKRMSFTRVRQLTKEHLLVLNEMKHLKELTLDTQPNLFDLDWLTNKSVHVEAFNCKNFEK